MNWTPRRKRFALILGGLLVLAAAAAFVLNAFQSNLVFFFTPSQVLKGAAETEGTAVLTINSIVSPM
jgi:cytochrome c-type biogenesis protein CcmE